MTAQRRAIGIVRVSAVKKRDRKCDGEGFISPGQQRKRMRRTLIRTTVDRAIVGPGRGAERITVELFGE